MKKATRKPTENSGMRLEYDFKDGVRGKHVKAMQSGYTVTIQNADGSKIVKEIKPAKGIVVLEPDVQTYFPNSESVNATLRSLIHLIPTKPGK